MHKPRALNLIRPGLHRRRDAFDKGLQRLGYDLADESMTPVAGDLVVMWNRYGGFNARAEQFEAVGGVVLIAENCPFGNDFLGGSFSLARTHVAMTGGVWNRGPDDRWDGWGMKLEGWRDSGGDTVVLDQRGIGHPTVASPSGWADGVARNIGGRVRRHPGSGAPVLPLREDLRRASAVVTWSSAAALQALMLGVPVWYQHPSFAGNIAAAPFWQWPAGRRCDDGLRLEAFRRLAWAIWTIPEIESGDALGTVIRGS